MATVDLDAPSPPPAGLLDALPRRVSLTLPELRFVAQRAGGAPLPFEGLVDGTGKAPGRALDGRLGPAPAATDADALARALASLPEPQSSLARRGLLVDTAVDEGLLGAVGLLAAPTIAVDIDVAVGESRVLAWHRQHADAVASLATADGIVFELAWFAADRWADELARVAVLPEDLVLRGSGVPSRLELPYELADAATEAVASHRPDLFSVLVAEHGGSTSVAGDAPADLEVAALLSALATEPQGRLRALVADVSAGATTVVGVVSWVLLADGWRALRPRASAAGGRIQVDSVEPADLARELAPVLAEVGP